MKNKFERAAIIDGNALIYKTYFAIAWKKDENEEFLMTKVFELTEKIIQTILSRNNYKYAVVAFDSHKETFRHKLLDKYKSNRSPMPKILFESKNQIDNIFCNNGFSIVQSPKNYEADDVIGTLSKKFIDQKIKTDIFSTDKDLLQLVNYYVDVHLLKTGISVTQTHTHENFEQMNDGILPYQIPFLKALMGDSSDNYSGITGIGQKTATEIIKKYRNQTNIYLKIDEFKEKIKNALIWEKENLNLYLKIATICKDVNISENVNDLKIKKK